MHVHNTEAGLKQNRRTAMRASGSPPSPRERCAAGLCACVHERAWGFVVDIHGTCMWLNRQFVHPDRSLSRVQNEQVSPRLSLGSFSPFTKPTKTNATDTRRRTSQKAAVLMMQPW